MMASVTRTFSTPQLDPRTYEQLIWLYGPSRAAEIRRGSDQAFNEGLAKWRNLGRGK